MASAIAVDTVIDEYFAPSSHGRVEPALQRAVQAANLRIFERAQREAALRSMETTIVALALTETHAYVAHVGDSRLYHWREGKLRRLTNDHTEAAELVRMRLVRPERLRDHPGRNALTRTLGSRHIVRPDFVRLPLVDGDRFLLCSDGLWSELDEKELQRVLASSAPEDACRALVTGALDAGATDNVSAQVVRVSQTGGATEENRRSGWRSRFFVRSAKAP